METMRKSKDGWVVCERTKDKTLAISPAFATRDLAVVQRDRMSAYAQYQSKKLEVRYRPTKSKKNAK